MTTPDAAIAARFPHDRFVSAGARSVKGATAARLFRAGLLDRRLKDPRLKVAALWEYRRKE